MTYDKFSDQMLIDAFVAGDKKCIEVLVQRYKDKVYTYILLNVKNVEEYIKLRRWKVRAGGNNHDSNSRVEYESLSPDVRAILYHPKENVLEWLKTKEVFVWPKAI